MSLLQEEENVLQYHPARVVRIMDGPDERMRASPSIESSGLLERLVFGKSGAGGRREVLTEEYRSLVVGRCVGL